MKLYQVLLLCAFPWLSSCEKNNDSSGDFLEITVNGQNHRRDETNGFGVSNVTGCNTKAHYLSNISQIDVATLFFEISLKHYENNIDFQSSTPGTYAVKADNIYGLNPISCNLDVESMLEDKTKTNQSTTVQSSSSSHIVTQVSRIGESSTDYSYRIKGTFTAVFKNSANQLITVTGNYQTTIQVLK